MAPTNDNSNPQGAGNPSFGDQYYKNKQFQHQQVTSTPRHFFNVPPTKKDERKIFVGGLPANITEDEFTQFFETFGMLIDSVVMFDRETGRSRGFGFVTFDDTTVCRQLLMMGNEGVDSNTDVMKLIGRIDIQGKTCELKAATPKANGMRGGHRGGDDPSRRMQHQSGYGIPPSLYHGGVCPTPPATAMYNGYPPAAAYFPPTPYIVPPSCAYGPPYMEYPGTIPTGPPTIFDGIPIGAASVMDPHIFHQAPHHAITVAPAAFIPPSQFDMPAYGMIPLVPMMDPAAYDPVGEENHA